MPLEIRVQIVSVSVSVSDLCFRDCESLMPSVSTLLYSLGAQATTGVTVSRVFLNRIIGIRANINPRQGALSL